MKKEFKFFPIAFIIIVLVSSIYIVNVNKLKYKQQPQPTRINALMKSENEKENHKKREDWIEEMHHAAPDIKWRKMDQDTRYEKSKTISQKSFKNNALEGYWKEVGSKNQSGRIHLAEIDTSNGFLYCASSGGNIWKSTLKDSSWTVLNNQFRMSGIHFLRIIQQADSKRILLATDQWNVQGFYYSDDEGSSWNRTTGLSSITNWGYIRRAVITNDNSHTIYLLAKEWDYSDAWESKSTIYVSTDLGESFSLLKTYNESTHGSTEKFDLWTNRYGSATVYLAQNDSLQKFESINTLVNVCDDIATISPGNYYLTGGEKNGITHLYLLVNHNDQGDVYASSNNGLTWTAQGNVDGNPFMINSFSCSAKNPDVLYYGSVDCFKSYTSGTSWIKVNHWGDYYGNPDIYLHADICGINSFLDENGDEFVTVSTDGGIYTSDDSLETVSNLSLKNLNVSQYYSTYTCRFNTDFTHAGSQDQGYQMATAKADTGAVEFDQVVSGDYGHIVSGDEGVSIWMVYPGFAAYYPNINNNRGSTWWDFVGSGFHWLPPLMADTDNPNMVYFGGGGIDGGAHIYTLTYSSENGITEEELSHDFSGSDNSKIAAMSYSPIDKSFRYLTTNNGEFFLSTNSGTQWVETHGITGPGANYLYGSAILPSKLQLGKLYVAGSGYSNPAVYVSNDHGKTFTAIDNGLPNTMVYEIAQSANEKLIFAATEVGPYVYIVDDNQWYDLMDAVSPDQIYWSVDFIPALNIARFGTYGRGIWDFVVTDQVSINSNEIADTDIRVFPNPTNGIFKLEINSVSNESIKIRIFNTAGQLIRNKIVDASPPSFQQEFDLTSESTGIYYVTIEYNSKTYSQKVIIK